MFQTELILWMQRGASPWLTELMLLVSRLGKDEFYQIALLVVLTGFSYQRGLWAAQTVITTAALIDWLKVTVMLPRPYHVDDRVVLLGSDSGGAFLHAAGASQFWALLPDSTVEIARRVGDLPWGMPSGHVSSAIAFWGSLMFQFRQRTLWGVGFALMALMPLSRLYLGRHFLADVLVAALVALTILVILLGVVKPWLHYQLHQHQLGQAEPNRKPITQEPLGAPQANSGAQAGAARVARLQWQWALLLPLLLWAVFGASKNAGFLLGLQLAAIGFHYWNWPTEGGSAGQRTGRVLVSVLIVGAGVTLLKAVAAAFPAPVMVFFAYAVVTAATVIASFALSAWLQARLVKAPTNPAA